jgi:NAD(P)H-quinone oxidoreductase subunit 5
MLHIDGLAVTVWVFSSLITVVIGAYSRRYIDPSDGRERFLVRMLAFLITVWLLAAADHLAMLVGAWVSMVWLMVGFVRHDSTWGVAHRSHQYVLRWFALAAVGLVASSSALWWADVTHLSALDTTLSSIPQPVAWIIATGVILTACSRCSGGWWCR